MNKQEIVSRMSEIENINSDELTSSLISEYDSLDIELKKIESITDL